MYFNYQGLGSWGWTGGHCVIGTTGGANNWFFAEGYTGEGFEVAVYPEPGRGQAANVTITYYPEEAAHRSAPSTKWRPPATRLWSARMRGRTRPYPLPSPPDQPVICERPMYFIFNGAWNGGHDVMGFKN